MDYDMYIYNLGITKVGNLYNNLGTSPVNPTVTNTANEIAELNFTVSYLNPCVFLLANKNLILWDGQVYEINNVQKSHREDGSRTLDIKCVHFSNALRDKQVAFLETDPLTSTNMLKALLYAGNQPIYGWIIGTVATSNAFRSITLKEQSIFEGLTKTAELFNAYLIFSSEMINGVFINTVNLYDKDDFGDLPAVEISVSKNLKDITLEYDSSEMVTRLYCFGGTDPATQLDVDIIDADVNGSPHGLTYVQNFDYYIALGYELGYIIDHPELFLKESVWRDGNYVDADTLYADAVSKLQTISVPRLTVNFNSIDIRDVDYGFDTARIGSPVWIRDEDIGILVQCIVTKIIRNFDTPWIYSFEVSNVIDYSNVLRSLINTGRQTGQTINPDGSIKPETIDALLDPIRDEIADLISSLDDDNLTDAEQVIIDGMYGDDIPSVNAKIVRMPTYINDKSLWAENILTTATATSMSIAIKKTGNSFEKVYIAYVTAGTLVVKSAILAHPVSQMVWSVFETIPNCVDCALVFDGEFVWGDEDDKVEFETDDLPYLFYTNSSNSLWYKKLGEEAVSLLGANVTDSDVIRGVASFDKSDDMGLIIFYVIGGVLYYNQLVAGAWLGQELVTYAPADVVSVHAERTFDYRICLHVTTATGELYEIFTKMYASGWNSMEFITAAVGETTLSVTEIGFFDYMLPDEYVTAGSYDALALPYGDVSPVMRDAWNYDDGNGDYGYYVLLRWTDSVDQALPDIDEFTMTDGYGITFYPQEVIRSDYPNRLLLHFMNFNNALNPLVVHYTPGTLTWLGSAVAADTVQFDATGLVPYYVDPPVMTSIYSVDNRTIRVEFDKPIVQLLSQNGFAVSGFEPFTSPEGALVPTNYVNELISLYDTYTVQIYLTYAGRLKHPQGNVTLLFTGQLLGIGGAFVAGFSEDFVPAGLTLWFKPNDPEYITIVPSATLVCFDVTYLFGKNDDEYITAAGYTATLVVTNVGGLPL